MQEFEFPATIEVIDSHTEGEPTRVVVSGWPTPAGSTMVERRETLRRDQDHMRRAVVCEPRGHAAVVGALLTPPVSSDAIAGVVFFNNVGYLGMCGHGLIGVVRTLAYLQRIDQGEVEIDTPVGTVAATLEKDHQVTIRNVPARCRALDVEIEVPEVGCVRGDIAWGGNWFYLTQLEQPPLELDHCDALLAVTSKILAAVQAADPIGEEGVIDHVELFGPPSGPEVDSRNFVLCPGREYDRSPCGTGTSAKMAVLHARGQLAPGQRWRQESITGGRFVGWLEETDAGLVPYIRGGAWITARSSLVFDPSDPLREGFSGPRDPE